MDATESNRSGAEIPQPGTAAFAAALEWRTGEDEIHRTRTVDGWNLGLYRYLPRTAPHARPVLLGHGFAGSRLLFDLSEHTSLARHLAASGFDTWLVDLRGRNDSWPDAGPDPALQWTFDDFVEFDIPAAIRHVLATTGSSALDWIGTEMSGIALYAAVLAGTAAEVSCGVTLGAPARTPPTAEVPGITTPFPEREQDRIPFSMVREVGPVLAAQQSDLLESSFRPTNTDWFVTGRYFSHGVPDEATALAEQFDDWIANDTARNRARTVDYAARLGQYRTPTLMMVGAADRQRPPDAVHATFEELGSHDKRFVSVGVASGFSVDAGHDDLIAGRASPAEVFPIIVDWLVDHEDTSA